MVICLYNILTRSKTWIFFLFLESCLKKVKHEPKKDHISIRKTVRGPLEGCLRATSNPGWLKVIALITKLHCVSFYRTHNFIYFRTNFYSLEYSLQWADVLSRIKNPLSFLFVEFCSSLHYLEMLGFVITLYESL